MSGFKSFRMYARYGLEASKDTTATSSVRLYQVRNHKVVEVRENKKESIVVRSFFRLNRQAIR